MKDVRFKDSETNVEFMLRSSAIIYDSYKTKILLFHPLKRKVYMLPGGKVEQLEQTKDAISREIFEELGWKLNFEFLGISEEFLYNEDGNTQIINIIYKAVYDKEIIEDTFFGNEGNWATFNWIDLKELDNIPLHPKEIKDIALDKINHVINIVR
jgi:ADP-ribose pyrophosphatase YjhB (NUDIX family)